VTGSTPSFLFRLPNPSSQREQFPSDNNGEVTRRLRPERSVDLQIFGLRLQDSPNSSIQDLNGLISRRAMQIRRSCNALPVISATSRLISFERALRRSTARSGEIVREERVSRGTGQGGSVLVAA